MSRIALDRAELIGKLRTEFVRLMTEDSETRDARRKTFNQAIFDKDDGRPVWNITDMGMVLGKFDKAVRNIQGR